MLLSIAAAAAMGGAAPLPPLKVQGSALVDPKGKPVTLRGVNLGNWLMLEMWMLGIAGQEGVPGDQWELEEGLARRFGEAKKEALMEVYRENWIKERDFSIIKSYRFNLLRLPLNYRMFEDDRDPKKLKPGAFKWVDRAIRLAENHGMYVILDMHGVQGGQSVYDHTGRSGQNKLWTSEENKSRLTWLWEEMAKRYRNHSAVVAYDVFNEPYGGTHPQQAEVFGRAYKAIRKHDPEKLIFAHGHYDGFAHYGSLTQNGWHNVGYQMHYYPGLFGNGNPTIRTHVRHLRSLQGVAKQVREFNAPFLVGEMNVVFGRAGGAEMMRRTYDLHESFGWMTTMWSYKTLGREGGFGDDHWGMASNAKPLGPVNFASDSYEAIEAWFKALGTMELAVNEKLRAALAPVKIQLPPLPEEAPARTTAPQDSLPGWTSLDLGNALKGGLKNLDGGKFELYGAGSDMWGGRDEGRFLARQASGDFVLSVKVEEIEDLEQYSKAGLMVRETSDADSAAAILTSFPSGEIQFATRSVTGVQMEAAPTAEGRAPFWLRLTRKGATLTADWSQEGREWKTLGSKEIPGFGPTVWVGPLALSHEPSSLIRIVYSGLTLSQP
jgi:endoglucanase